MSFSKYPRSILCFAVIAAAPGCTTGADPALAPARVAAVEADLGASASEPRPASVSTVSAGAALVPPPGFAAPVIASDKKPHDCPTTAMPYTGTLEFPSKFEGSDKARDDLNPKAEKEFRKLTAPITALERGVSQQVEDYLRSGNKAALGCALGMLRDWSAAGALMGEATTYSGKSMRKWALGSVASSYLRLKFSSSRPLEREAELVRGVEVWMGQLADRVVEEWNDLPLEKTNNHKYWAAWSVMATAVALDRRDLFDWSMKQLEVATNQIDAEGYLPNELKRDTRALYYHNYALTPLTMIAAFAKANGSDPGARSREALVRLAERVLAGVDAPESFMEKTGKSQSVGDFSGGKFAWMEPYCWTFSCSAALEQRLDALRPLQSFRLGGNLTQIFHPPAAATGAAAPSAPTSTSRQESSPWTNPLASL